MNRPELYKKTVDILYQAYFDDTLEHMDCQKCAVGNLIRGNLKASFSDVFGEPVFIINGSYYAVPWSHYEGKEDIPVYEKPVAEIIGYCENEMDLIEDAFEAAYWERPDCDQLQFFGLAAVLDVLAQIHEVTDQDLITTTNKRFSDHYKTRLCTTNT